MPTLTLTLTKDELARFTRIADRRQLTPKEFGAKLIRHEISRVEAAGGQGIYRARRIDQLARQFKLAEAIRTDGFPTTKEQVEALAIRLGASIRTIYRDLDLLAASRQRTDPTATRPRGRTSGRPPRQLGPGAADVDTIRATGT